MTEENKKSLMKKTKSELVEIIARKDDTEQKYASTIKELEKNVVELSDELSLKLNIIKSYEEGNSEFGEKCKKYKNEVSQLQHQNVILEEKINQIRKEYDHQLQGLKSRLNTVQEDKEDLQVKCAELEVNCDELYCESNKYKNVSRILTILSVALLGAVMLLIF